MEMGTIIGADVVDYVGVIIGIHSPTLAYAPVRSRVTRDKDPCVWPKEQIVFASCHPGWTDTPGWVLRIQEETALTQPHISTYIYIYVYTYIYVYIYMVTPPRTNL